MAIKFTLLIVLFTTSVFGDRGKVSFCAVGDLCVGRGVAVKIQKEGVHSPFIKISPLVKRHTIALCNLESQISNHGMPTSKLYHFSLSPDSGKGLLDAGFTIFGLANNHIYDFGPVALRDTKTFIEKNGLNAPGAGSNRWEAAKPTIIDTNGIRIAVFAVSSFYPPGLPLRTPRTSQPFVADSASLKAIIKKIRPSVDIVIISIHWGVEYKHFPSDKQTLLAHAAIDAGADLIVGHHPHAIQSIEKYKSKFILYSLGNFVFDQKFEMGSESLLFSGTLTKSGILYPAVIPLTIKNCQPALATGENYQRITRMLRKYSNGMGATIADKSGALYLN